MTEEELEAWFALFGGRGATIKRFPSHWEARVFDLEFGDFDGDGAGDTLVEALSDAIAKFEVS